MKTLNRIAIITTSVIFLTNCSTIKPATLRPTEPSTKISVTAYGSTEHTAVYGSEQVGRDIASGSVGGAALGFGTGFVSGLACGPLFIFCSPAGAIVGAGAGAVIGGVAGGVTAGVTSLPKEKAEALNVTLNRLFLEQDVANLLTTKFKQKASETFAVVDNSPEVRIILGIPQLAFNQHSKDELTLHISGSMQIHYGFREQDKTSVMTFSSTSPRYHVDHWMDEDNQVLEHEIDKAFTDVSQKMVRALVHPGNTFH